MAPSLGWIIFGKRYSAISWPIGVAGWVWYMTSCAKWWVVWWELHYRSAKKGDIHRCTGIFSELWLRFICLFSGKKICVIKAGTCHMCWGKGIKLFLFIIGIFLGSFVKYLVRLGALWTRKCLKINTFTKNKFNDNR